MSLDTDQHGNVNTLCFDVGGTGIKASVLDVCGQMLHERCRVDTPYPLTPQHLVDVLADLTLQLPHFDRVSLGFPGMVRSGKILSAPHFVSPTGPGGRISEELLHEWVGWDLQSALADRLARPAKVANDADVQGAAVIEGKGLELVITLGTGVGTAVFHEGKLCPHLELAHHPLHKGLSYNEVLGEAARRESGTKTWNRRLGRTIRVLRLLTFFDHCYIGGGNSARVRLELPADVSLADNAAGVLGGIKLWERLD